MNTTNEYAIKHCKNCKYFRPCKRLESGNLVWFRICMVLADEPDGWCLVVDDNDRCEMFEKQ